MSYTPITVPEAKAKRSREQAASVFAMWLRRPWELWRLRLAVTIWRTMGRSESWAETPAETGDGG